jgi:hypothetical protein
MLVPERCIPIKMTGSRMAESHFVIGDSQKRRSLSSATDTLNVGLQPQRMHRPGLSMPVLRDESSRPLRIPIAVAPDAAIRRGPRHIRMALLIVLAPGSTPITSLRNYFFLFLKSCVPRADATEKNGFGGV